MLAEQDSNSKPMIVNLSEFRSFHEQEAVRFRLMRATAGLWWIKAWLESQAKKHELLSLRKARWCPRSTMIVEDFTAGLRVLLVRKSRSGASVPFYEHFVPQAR